jgi:RimJ/RimL family protein N-acetyltransferase
MAHPILQTPRLGLRRLTPTDAPFILGLLNQPSFVRHIGDRGVRTLEDASTYIVNGPIASYQKHGFGLYLVETRNAATPIGICGLLKRDALDEVEVGYAFLPEFSAPMVKLFVLEE